MNEIIRSIEAKQIRSDLPQINVGDTVRVWVKVVEGNRERLQAFEALLLPSATAASGKLSLFAVYPMALVLNVLSRSTLPVWITLN